MLQYGARTYREMTENRLSGYLAGLPDMVAHLGGRQALWQIAAVRSGPFAAVFIVEGPGGSVCVKQAFPASIELDQRLGVPPGRIRIEEAALTLHGRFAPGSVPRLLHYDFEQALLVMERLPRHTTLRSALIEGRSFARLAEQIASFLARASFFTSDLALPSAEKKEWTAQFSANVERCRVIEHRTFTEPYTRATAARWISPQLDGLARNVQADEALKRTVSKLKLTFMTEAQALCHGGLDLDAIMVAETDTKVISPSRALFGPIGFDLGTLLGHLLLAYFSRAGHVRRDAPRAAMEHWLLDVVVEVWQSFKDQFLGLWRSAHAGDAYPPALFEGPSGSESLRLAQADYMQEIFEDALRFAGAAMIRHTLGRDHVAEFTEIADPELRARCERRAILLGRELLKDADYVADITEVRDAARQLRSGDLDGV